MSNMKKRGRPIGSMGFIGIKLSDLNAKLTPDFIVPIRTSLARQLFPDQITIIHKPEKTDLTKLEETCKVSFNIIEP